MKRRRGAIGRRPGQVLVGDDGVHDGGGGGEFVWIGVVREEEGNRTHAESVLL